MEESPPIETTPIPVMNYKPKEGDIGNWDFNSRFSQNYSKDYSFESLKRFLEALKEPPKTPQEALMADLQKEQQKQLDYASMARYGQSQTGAGL